MVKAELIVEVKNALSPERFAHTAGVARTARKLAERFGADEEKAELSGWIHDIAREYSPNQLLDAAETLQLPNGFGAVPALLHGPIAADLLLHKYGYTDEDMANAVRYHTTGRVGMSTLEKILCLADAIEPGRAYAGVDELREIAKNDLDLALAMSLDNVILYLIQSQRLIFPLTVMARNDLWEHYHEENFRRG